MRRFFLLLSLISLLYSCDNYGDRNGPSESENEFSGTDGQNSGQEELPKSLNQEGRKLLEDFPKSWHLLTKMGKEYVLYYPCDANNRQITFYIKANEYHIDFDLGQDAMQFKILKCTKRNEEHKDGNTYFYDFTLLELLSHNPEHVTVYYGNEKSIALWTWSGEVTISDQFVPKILMKQYNVITQPCRDCWEDEQCPDEDPKTSVADTLFSNGVLRIMATENTAISFYTTPEDKKFYKKLKVTLEGGVDDAWFKPLDYWPKFDIIYMFILGKEKDMYKVISNKDTKEVLFVPEQKNMLMMTWEEYLKSASAVHRIAPISNLVREEPNDNANAVQLPEVDDCFKVLEKKGNWVKVMYADFCWEDSENQQNIIGWIRWRNERELLISIDWVM